MVDFGGDEDSVLQAQRLFAALTEPAGDQGNGAPPRAAPGAPAPRPAPAQGAAAAGEVLDLARAALATTDRLAEVIELIGNQADDTGARLATIAAAVEQALTATNDRLASLERALLGGEAPAAEPAEWALARLRRLVRDPGSGD